MREILFRGKRIDNGEWIEGYYFRVWDDHYICWGTTNGDVNKIQIIPETVEQYTGLKDKHGKKIFEGDVMHWDSYWGWYVGHENGAFRRIPLNDTQRINWKHYTLQQEDLYTWEVIGNIHDNPELLDS